MPQARTAPGAARKISRKTIRLHRVQHDFRRSAALYRGFVGGRGSGKSWVGAYDLIRRSKPGRTYLVASPTATLLDDTTLPMFRSVAQDLGVWGSIKLTPYPTATLSTGAAIRFRTAEDPEKLRGPNLSGIWLDEASLMARDAYTIAIACLREAGEQGWLTATFTPKGLDHWTYSTFGRETPDTAIFHARTRDNPFLPAGFQDRLALQYTGLFADQELEGLFVNIEGAEWPAEYFGDSIWFEDWPRDLDLRVLALDPSKGKSAKFGDYSAFVWIGRDRATKSLWIDADLARRPVTQIVSDGYDICQAWQPQAFVVETNQFQELLATEFIRFSREREKTLPIYGITSTVAKDVRIRTLGPLLAQGRLRFRAGSAGARLLVQQLRNFPEADHDDGPDATHMGITMLNALLGGGGGPVPIAG